jgi:hypothetical protein
MNIFCGWVTLVTGVWLIFWSFMLTGKNAMSNFLLRFIPFFLGLANLIVAGMAFGLISIG